MKAIILAAGQAKRLQSLTVNTPKCLLPIRGKPLIDYQMAALIRNGINEIVLVVGFRKEKIISHLTQTYPDLTFRFIENELYEKTGPAYSLYLAREWLTDTVLYLNSDVLYGANIIKRVRKTPKPSATALQRSIWDEEEVNIVVNERGLVTEIGKHIPKERSCGEFIGVTKFDEKFNKKLVPVLEYFVNEQSLNKFAAEAIDLTITRGGKIYAVDVTDLETLEIDTREDLARAERMFSPLTRLKQDHPFFSAWGTYARVRRALSFLRSK